MNKVPVKKQVVYVYEDTDHGEVEVFTTLKKAKAHAEKHWPACKEETSPGEFEIYPVWENEDGFWRWGEYVFIFKKTVK